ncbi:MAG: hypothetical protein ACOQNY_00805 [Mycoplasmoidaceae bacterium]
MEVETLALIINALVLALVVCGTVLLLWRLKLASKNKVLLFVLFILYWMAPLMCREYTGQMHIHQPNYDGGSLLWVPLTVYGFAGLLWRPLTDVISFKLKSRKNVLYLSLAVQLLTIWPMFVWPDSFAMNIIQSIGTGIGASGIGLFNLMFTEQEHHRKLFTTVSILALPPLIAEFITSCMEAVLCGLVPEHGVDPETPDIGIYLEYLKYLWLFAIVFIIASFIITIFVKEEREYMFKSRDGVEAVNDKHDGWVIALICLAGMCFIFVRWVTAGPSSVTQLIYIAVGPDEGPSNPIIPSYILQEVKYFEGYLSLMFAMGQMVGAICAALMLSKHRNNGKWVLIVIGFVVWTFYLVTNEQIINVYVFFWTNILNGIGFGLMYPVFIGTMLNKQYRKVKIITPIGLFNTAMALGIVFASVFNNVIKGPVYDFHFTYWTSEWADFQHVNTLVNYVTLCVGALMVAFFAGSFAIHKKHPPQITNLGIKFAIGSEMEI